MINQIFNAVVAYQAVEEIFNRIDREQNGKLDVLVNNAYAGKLSNPEYIHLQVDETINNSAIFLLQFFELIFVFIVEETLLTNLKIIGSVLRILVFLQALT